ncbi:hypothetical protein BJX76DRAFT_167140 [Aspergillus varians]
MTRFNKAKSRKASKNTYTGITPSHLSMQQEARNTEGRNLWRLNAQLRCRAVQFVSAGNLEPAQELTPNSTAEEAPANEDNRTRERACELITNESSGYKSDSGPASEITTATSPILPARPCSHMSEDSSEDEVVFRGRRSSPRFNNDVGSQPPSVGGNLSGEIDESPACTNTPIAPADASPGSAESNISREDTPNWIRINCNAARSRPKMSEEDEILADYIAHIIDDESGDESSSAEEQPLGDDGAPADIQEDLKCCYSAREDIDTDYHDLSSEEALDDETHHVLSNLSQSARKNPDDGTFASATAFSDALELDPYYKLDIMDFSRPSLRKKKSKKLGHLDFEALDTELENKLVTAWNNDRLKKKSKKREREELRARGLLGRRKDDPDLKTKYTDGIDIEDLKSEIRLFLLSPKNSLSLPPMTKHRRMLIHDMAHALRLTSQSRGRGSSRFPVLSKTSRTPKYTHGTISQMDRVFSKERFSPRALKAWDKTSGQSAKTKSGHGNVSYMDGDVVGASAPEIGAENKGRAMLEKMGWSTGTALGATNNKGILLPVAQVVKNSKAGLG